MLEQQIFKPEIVEAEIAELSKQIEARRRVLEANVEKEKGVEIVESPEETVHAVLADTIKGEIGTLPAGGFHPQASQAQSYLAALGTEDAEKLNGLIEVTFNKGIKSAVKELPGHSPFIIQAYHKVLAEQLTAELKSRGLI